MDDKADTFMGNQPDQIPDEFMGSQAISQPEQMLLTIFRVSGGLFMLLAALVYTHTIPIANADAAAILSAVLAVMGGLEFFLAPAVARLLAKNIKRKK